MNGIAHLLRRLALLTVLAFALVATGFAHRLPHAADADLQAFVLAGGDLGSICDDLGDTGQSSHPDCPACQIVGAADLPSATPALRDANLIFIARVIAPRESRTVRDVRDPARGLRAPPLA